MQFLAVCQICGLGIEKNVEGGIELLDKNCDGLDHNNTLMYRLAKLLSTDNYLGNMKIPAELIAMKKVMEIAKQKEDEKQIDSIGFDSSYIHK